MKLKKASSLFFLFLIYNFLSATEIKLIRKIDISQKEKYLNISDLAVTDDEVFIFTDAKESNIKLYNNKGEIIKIWGQRGPGPDELNFPSKCDFNSPFFALLDTGKMRVYIYRYVKDNLLLLKKLNSILCVGCVSPIKIYKKDIIIASYTRDKNNKKYNLYMKNFNGKNTRYLLPHFLKWGFKSEGEYQREYEIIPKYATPFVDFDVAENCVYYAWEGLLKIIKINLKTKEIHFFGKETENYTRPKPTKKIVKAFEERKVKLIEKEREKMSWVIGVFADKDFIGVLYNNFDKKTSLWKAICQFYKPDGEFMGEYHLPDAVDYSIYGPKHFYDKINNNLYILSRKLNEESYLDEYQIMKYQILK